MVVKEEFRGKETFKCEEQCREEGVCDFEISTKSLEKKAIT
ncbi:MAG: hypothetical protein ABEJ98_04520 [Candidatus Nanohaloarchaea archaeon]